MCDKCARSEAVASVTVDDAFARHFWKAIKLSVIKPHTINRILSGSEIVSIYRIVDGNSNVNGQLIDQLTSALISGDRSTDGAIGLLENFLRNKQHELVNKEDFVEDDPSHSRSITIVLSKYFPRNLKVHRNSLELVLLSELLGSKL